MGTPGIHRNNQQILKTNHYNKNNRACAQKYHFILPPGSEGGRRLRLPKKPPRAPYEKASPRRPPGLPRAPRSLRRHEPQTAQGAPKRRHSDSQLAATPKPREPRACPRRPWFLASNFLTWPSCPFGFRFLFPAPGRGEQWES